MVHNLVIYVNGVNFVTQFEEKRLKSKIANNNDACEGWVTSSKWRWRFVMGLALRLALGKSY